MVQLLRQVKKDNEMDDTVTCRYNTAAMTNWVVQQLKILNPSIFQLDSSQFSVALFLLTLMELSQLLRALVSPQVANVSQLKIALQHQVQEARQRCKALISEIRSKDCILISQNTEKSRDVLLLSRNEAVEKSEDLLSPLLQLELHCVYSNLLLNMRRAIRHTWQTREAELSHRFRSLTILHIILYYLSAATFAPAENAVRVMANDILSSDRQVTFVHLIHDEDGLRKLSHYLQEAPLSDVEKDIDFISNLITRRA